MKPKKVTMIIEASKDGFGIYGKDFPYTAYGKTIEAAKQDLQNVVKETLQFFKDEDKAPDAALNNGDLAFEYKYDIASIFEHFGVLDASQFAKKIGMNASLLRQYKSGHALASDKQKQKIENGLHALGRELLSVKL